VCSSDLKLFSEVAENADPDPIRGIRATGASWPQIMRYGALPQVAPAFLSYGLLRFEINVRAASVLGFVGAGGIGQELYTAIKSFAYTDISAIAIMLIISVALIDMVSERLRHRIIGAASLRATA
jgi:phosphonate transport system permease protein